MLERELCRLEEVCFLDRELVSHVGQECPAELLEIMLDPTMVEILRGLPFDGVFSHDDDGEGPNEMFHFKVEL